MGRYKTDLFFNYTRFELIYGFITGQSRVFFLVKIISEIRKYIY